MLKVLYERSFVKDYKLLKKRGYDMKRLDRVVYLLANQTALPERCHDHALVGQFKGLRECHVAPDWLLVYRINGQELVLSLTRTGTHSDIFG